MMTTTKHNDQAMYGTARRILTQWFAGSFAVAALGAFGTASAQTPIVIQFSHVVTGDTAKGKAT